MPLYRLVETSALDATQQQIAFNTVGANHFLKFGLLGEANLRTINALDVGGRVGFYPDTNPNSNQISNVGILARYDATDGLQISAIPTGLTVGQSYEPRFTQPGSETDDTDTASTSTATAQNITVYVEQEFDMDNLIFVVSLPEQIRSNQVAVFVAAATGLENAYDTDGRTAVTDAVKDDAFKAINGRWIKQTHFGGGIDVVTIPTYSQNTEYVVDQVFVFATRMYRVKVAIAADNSRTIAQLITDDAIEMIGAEDVDLPDWVSDDNVRVPANKGGLTLEQTELLTRVAGIDIRDFRDGIPAAPAPNAPAAELALARKTIGIGNHGVNWTFELITRGGTWNVFDNDKFEGALPNRLPGSAVADGDFYYLPNHGASPQHGVWIRVSGLTTSESEDVDTFLTNHHFLGNFTSQKAAENAITSYDSNITYLAYFPTVISGRSGRIVQQLTSFTDVPSPTSKWIESDYELRDLINDLENQILHERDRIGINIGAINDLRNQLRIDENGIATALRTYPVTDLSDWTRVPYVADTIAAEQYSVNANTLLIHHEDDNNEDKSAEIGRIRVNSAIAVGTHRFIITGFEGNTNYHKFTGYWEKVHGIDTTANNAVASIGFIDKDVRWGVFSEASDIVGFEAEVEKHIGENRPTTRFETIEKAGLKGVPTKADFEGDYVLYMRGAHSKLQQATKIDINFQGIEIASDVAWQDDELLVPFSISSAHADSLNTNLSGTDTKVRVQISFREADDTFIDRVDIDFGIGAAYSAPTTSTSGLNQAQVTEIANQRARARYSDAEKTKLGTVEANAKDDQTGAEIVGLLEALGVGNRLNYSWLDGKPTIPIDTTIFFGPYAASTAIPANRLVTYNNDVYWTIAAIPSSNTDAPDANSNFEQLDIGSPNDLVGMSINNNVITVNRRNGTSFTITLPTSTSGGITTEENRFERLLVNAAATTNVRFRVFGQGALPARDQSPRLQGTSWEIDYRDVAGKLIVFEPNTSANTTFEINLQDLLAIRTELIGTDLDGSVFLFANKSNKTGMFTANPAIAQVFPAGQTLAAESIALVTMNSIGANGSSQTYELLLQPLGGSGEDDKEVLYGSGAPAGSLGAVGDSYVNVTNGKEYKKATSTSWIERVDFATQAELNAVSATATAAQNAANAAGTNAATAKTTADTARNEAAAATISPRRVSELPDSPYTEGDQVYLTAVDGSNQPGLYQVFAAANGYEPAVVSRKPLVVLDWNETRAYADVILPANYTSYRNIKVITSNASGLEYVAVDFPVAALQDSRRDGGNSVLGWGTNASIDFNRTTRVISRAGNGVAHFIYIELY